MEISLIRGAPPNATARFRSLGPGYLLVPVAALATLATILLVPGLNPAQVLPAPHFYTVTTVAAIAFAISLLLSVTAVQAQHYKLLLLALGFMTMAGLFAVHGLATPGVLLPLSDEYANPSIHSLAATSGYLSLAIPALFFAIAYTPLLGLYERRLPFWPAGGLIVLVSVALLAFGIFGFSQTDIVLALPLTVAPGSYLLAAGSIACLVFAGAQQWRGYSRERLPLQGALAMAFPMLGLAQMAMVLAPAWTPAWWEYHVLMLVAVGVALRALAVERVRGRSLRFILEAALDLQVKAELEIDRVEEIAVLAAAIEAKDRDTRGHTARVAELTVLIARELGLPSPALRSLARAGLLHDIGKLQISDELLNKPGPLTDEEWLMMKQHPQMGVDILVRLGKFEDEAQIVLSHHERIDGSGYPGGLRAGAIPLGARILSVADTYDVLVSDRPYRKARTREEAMLILREESGHHLYAPAVNALFNILSSQDSSDRRRVPRVRSLPPLAFSPRQPEAEARWTSSA
jgi:putative nucleotidyltransferase with HDIG domain